MVEEQPQNGSGFGSHLKALADTMNARLLDSDTNVVSEVPVRDLAGTLASCTDDIESVIFDGMITQRILDIATEKNVKYLIGAEMGRITKQPTTIKILTAADM